MAEMVTFRACSEPLIVFVERHRFEEPWVYHVECMTLYGVKKTMTWNDIVRHTCPLAFDWLERRMIRVARQHIGEKPHVINGRLAGRYLRKRFLEWRAGNA